MSTRTGDGAGSSIERWLSGLAGPELDESPVPGAAYGDGEQPATGIDASKLGAERDRYDEDYEYYWGSVRIPLWIALIWQVPWRQRLDIFVIGLIVGLVISGLALFWGFVLSQY